MAPMKRLLAFISITYFVSMLSIVMYLHITYSSLLLRHQHTGSSTDGTLAEGLALGQYPARGPHRPLAEGDNSASTTAPVDLTAFLTHPGAPTCSDGGGSNSSQQSAEGTADPVFGGSVTFRPLGEEMYLLDAYLDRRVSTAQFVRILLTGRSEVIQRLDRLFVCLLANAAGRRPAKAVRASVYEMNENHARSFGGFILSCALPKLEEEAAEEEKSTDHSYNSSGTKASSGFYQPCAVRLLTRQLVFASSSASVSFVDFSLMEEDRILQSFDPTNLTQPQQQEQREFTLCIPPLHGHIAVEKFVQFVEMNRLLGAGHFHVYNFNSAESSSPLLQAVWRYYSSPSVGLLDVLQWKLPFPQQKIWYFGQMLAIHHCLYRTMATSKYTVFQDLDELLVPQVAADYVGVGGGNWSEMMRHIDSGQHCGYCAKSAFFLPAPPLVASTLINSSSSISQPTTQAELWQLLRLNVSTYFTSLQRTSLNTFRTKCLVRPQLIFEMGIHHISKQNVEWLTPGVLEPSLALLHHYRQCDRHAARTLCNVPTQTDSILLGYQSRLYEALHTMAAGSWRLFTSLSN